MSTASQPAASDDDGAELRAKLGISTFYDAMDGAAREYLTKLLTSTGGDRMTAAAVAGLNRTHMQALIKRHKVEVKPNFKNRGRRRPKPGDRGEAGEAKVAGDRIDW